MLTPTKFWIWLTQALPPIAAWRVLEQFGTPEKVYFADKPEYARIPELSEKELNALSDKSMECTEQIIADCQRLSVRTITWQDADYPERLRMIELPPMVLYVKGRPLHFDDEPLIAMAGTRKASPYGMKMARIFARQITEGGGLVVTGVAKGCDQNAIMGAFDARGSVIAVLPGGVDVPFSKEESSRLLYRDLARYGTMVSEYPPGTPNTGKHFHMRNRILTGLSLAVLCVEAGRRSGTLQVAAYAREQDRTVYVVPARLDDESAYGTNELMCSGYALPVMSGREILEAYVAMYPRLLRTPAQAAPTPASQQAAEPERAEEKPVIIEQPKPEKSEQPPVTLPENSETGVDTGKTTDYIDVDTSNQSLTQDERQLLRCFGPGVMTAEELIAASGMSAPTVMAALTMLAINGSVISEDGGRFRLAAPRS